MPHHTTVLKRLVLINWGQKVELRMKVRRREQLLPTQCMRNGGFWFKVKVLSFKIRFCNADSDSQLTPTTAHAQTLAFINKHRNGIFSWGYIRTNSLDVFNMCFDCGNISSYYEKRIKKTQTNWICICHKHGYFTSHIIYNLSTL